MPFARKLHETVHDAAIAAIPVRQAAGQVTFKDTVSDYGFNLILGNKNWFKIRGIKYTDGERNRYTRRFVQGLMNGETDTYLKPFEAVKTAKSKASKQGKTAAAEELKAVKTKLSLLVSNNEVEEAIKAAGAPYNKLWLKYRAPDLAKKAATGAAIIGLAPLIVAGVIFGCDNLDIPKDYGSAEIPRKTWKRNGIGFELLPVHKEKESLTIRDVNADGETQDFMLDLDKTGGIMYAVMPEKNKAKVKVNGEEVEALIIVNSKMFYKAAGKSYLVPTDTIVYESVKTGEATKIDQSSFPSPDLVGSAESYESNDARNTVNIIKRSNATIADLKNKAEFIHKFMRDDRSEYKNLAKEAAAKLQDTHKITIVLSPEYVEPENENELVLNTLSVAEHDYNVHLLSSLLVEKFMDTDLDAQKKHDVFEALAWIIKDADYDSQPISSNVLLEVGLLKSLGSDYLGLMGNRAKYEETFNDLLASGVVLPLDIQRPFSSSITGVYSSDNPSTLEGAYASNNYVLAKTLKGKTDIYYVAVDDDGQIHPWQNRVSVKFPIDVGGMKFELEDLKQTILTLNHPDFAYAQPIFGLDIHEHFRFASEGRAIYTLSGKPELKESRLSALGIAKVPLRFDVLAVGFTLADVSRYYAVATLAKGEEYKSLKQLMPLAGGQFINMHGPLNLSAALFQKGDPVDILFPSAAENSYTLVRKNDSVSKHPTTAYFTGEIKQGDPLADLVAGTKGSYHRCAFKQDFFFLYTEEDGFHFGDPSQGDPNAKYTPLTEVLYLLDKFYDTFRIDNKVIAIIPKGQTASIPAIELRADTFVSRPPYYLADFWNVLFEKESFLRNYLNDIRGFESVIDILTEGLNEKQIGSMEDVLKGNIISWIQDRHGDNTKSVVGKIAGGYPEFKTLNISDVSARVTDIILNFPDQTPEGRIALNALEYLVYAPPLTRRTVGAFLLQALKAEYQNTARSAMANYLYPFLDALDIPVPYGSKYELTNFSQTEISKMVYSYNYTFKDIIQQHPAWYNYNDINFGSEVVHVWGGPDNTNTVSIIVDFNTTSISVNGFKTDVTWESK